MSSTLYPRTSTSPSPSGFELPLCQQSFYSYIIRAVSVTHSACGFLLEPLPNLDIPARRTVSHALPRIKFVGALGQWTNFKTEVANTYNSHTWNPREIASRLTANFLAGSVHEEQVFVSDERGVQGRLEGRAGTFTSPSRHRWIIPKAESPECSHTFYYILYFQVYAAPHLFPFFSLTHLTSFILFLSQQLISFSRSLSPPSSTLHLFLLTWFVQSLSFSPHYGEFKNPPKRTTTMLAGRRRNTTRPP